MNRSNGGLRNVNLDVLRCFAMVAIVLCHVYQHDTAVVPVSSTRDMLFLLLIRWHVDVFVGLSGWFGMIFSFKKFGKIWGLIAFYSLVSIIVGRCVLGDSTPIRVDGGWFGNAYLCLMLIAPILNAAVENLVSKGHRIAWLAWGGFAIVMMFNWVSRNCYFGIHAWDVFSHSLVQMVFVYFTVRLFRLTGLVNHVRLWHIGAATLFFVAGCFVLGKARTDYIAPYTITMAIALLVLFDKYVKFPKWLTSACVWAAPAMFGVYLLHGPTSFGKLFHRIPLRYIVEVGINSELAVVCAALVCFAICLMLEVVRKYLFKHLTSCFAPIKPNLI